MNTWEYIFWKRGENTMLDQNRKGVSTATWVLIGVVVLMLVIFGVPNLTNENGDVLGTQDAVEELNRQGQELGDDLGNVGEEGAEEVPDINVEDKDSSSVIEDVNLNPQNYVGREVTVTAEIEEIMGNNVLTLEGPGLEPDQDLIIVSSQGFMDQNNQPVYSDEDILTVTGTVQMLNVANVESALGIDIPDDVLSDQPERPVIVARTVTVAQEAIQGTRLN
jgi:hypothetical protein